MNIETSTFGKLQIDEEKIITFENGIPGFENLKKFVIIILQQTHPFLWLQSVEEDISLPMMSPFEIDEQYSPTIDDQELEMLKVNDEKDVLVLVVCVIPQDVSKMTANMVAPVLINIKAGLGKQVLANEGKYQVRQPIFDFISKKMHGGENASTDS